MKVNVSWGDFVPPNSSEPYWSCTVTLYASSVEEAREDRTVLECKWEVSDDIAYAVITLGGSSESVLEEACDNLLRDLEAEKYDYEEL